MKILILIATMLFYAVGKLDEFKKWALTLDYYEMYNLIGLSSVSGGLVNGDKGCVVR